MVPVARGTMADHRISAIATRMARLRARAARSARRRAMRALAARWFGWSLASVIVLAPAHAIASCYNSLTNVFAVGVSCSVLPNSFNPLPPPSPVSISPYTYTGFGFLAGVAGGTGGSITTSGTVTIDTTGAINQSNTSEAYGVWSDGAGSTINLGGVANLTTTGATRPASTQATGARSRPRACPRSACPAREAPQSNRRPAARSPWAAWPT